MKKDVASVTTFTHNVEQDQWYWSTRSSNGKIIGDGGEGYHNLTDCVRGYFAQQGTSLEEQALGSLESDYSKLNPVGPGKFAVTKYKTTKNTKDQPPTT